MGRTAKWLEEQRPAMVEVLRHIEEQSGSSRRGRMSLGDLTNLLAEKCARPIGNQQRTPEAMRKAWNRWTTDTVHKATPAVLELAAIVRFARQQGWLIGSLSEKGLALVFRLDQAFESEQRLLREKVERSWLAQARAASDGLFAFLDVRLNELAQKDAETSGGMGWDASFPPSLVVQREYRAMFETVLTRLVLSVAEDRSDEGGDAFLREGEGWSEVFRALAEHSFRFLSEAADDCENLSEIPSAPVLDSRLRRRKLLGRT